MNPTITHFLYRLRLGPMQKFQNMAVFPLFSSIKASPDYLTLPESLAARLITITEVNPSGSVSELKVVNRSEQFILLLDGEELIGAKQNRVLNTSILLQKKSETIIPVSCTEQGRWAYSSATLAYSETMLSHMARSSKSRSVSLALRQGRGHSSDQGRVWSEIARIAGLSGTSSPTRAMRDVYTAKSDNLAAYSQAFKLLPEQQGSLVIINGQVIGFDMVSRPAAYKMLHGQLIKSYALEALLQKAEAAKSPSIYKSVQFLEDALRCCESQFEAVGLGSDYRFEGRQVVGSSLVYENRVIHVTFFAAKKNEPDGCAGRFGQGA